MVGIGWCGRRCVGCSVRAEGAGVDVGCEVGYAGSYAGVKLKCVRKKYNRLQKG